MGSPPCCPKPCQAASAPFSLHECVVKEQEVIPVMKVEDMAIEN